MELMNKLPLIEEEDLTRIWKEHDKIKVFISHKNEHKNIASEIQKNLSTLGISSFVAHKDISPTEDWKKEILIALQSMDIFLPYITPNFSRSEWTNQEIGFALGKNIPIIPFKDQSDPCGFISCIQAQKYSSKSFNENFINIVLIQRSIPETLKQRTINILIHKFSNSCSFANASFYFDLLKNAQVLNPSQIEKIVLAFNENSQVNNCFDLNGENFYGKKGESTICKELERWTGVKYEIISLPRGRKLQVKQKPH